MAAVRSDRIGVPVGLHERRVLAWLRSRADDSLARSGGTIQSRPVVAAR